MAFRIAAGVATPAVEKTLARVQRLYGEAVRQRIQYDPWLVPIRFRKGLGTVDPDSLEPSEEAFDKFVDLGYKAYKRDSKERREASELEYYDYLRDHYQERIEFLEQYRDDPTTLMIGGTGDRVRRRIEVLTWARNAVQLKANRLGRTS